MAGYIDLTIVLLRLLQQSQGKYELNALLTKLNITLDELKLACDDLNSLSSNTISIEQEQVILHKYFDLLDQNTLHLDTKSCGRVSLCDKISSTNTVMLQNAHNLVKGDVLITEIQTHGRGRRDRVWQGSLANQLTFSLAYSFTQIKSVVGMAIAVGSILVQTIRDLGFSDVYLKWPNDIYFKDKKLGGILIETVQVKNNIIAIIGIGFNVYKHEALNENAIALFDNIKQAQEQNLNRNKLAVSFINAVRKALIDFEKNGFINFVSITKEFDYLKGKHIELITNNKKEYAYVKGINEQAMLELIIDSQEVAISSGYSIHIV